MQAPADQAGASSAKPAGSEAAAVVRIRSKKRERPETLIVNHNNNKQQQRPGKSLRSHGHGDRDLLLDEASTLTDKDGGLRDAAAVKKILYIMEQDSMANRPMDLRASRTMLAKIITATTEMDILAKFVKLGGLPVLDRWLQEEAHRHKVSEESSNDYSCDHEDLLFSVLKALEVLPVDLIALQSCGIGKSVKTLRSLKNHDLQRRSKMLVEMWKKQVNAEIKQGSHEQQSSFSLDMSSQKTNKSRDSCPFEASMASSGSRGRHSASLSSSPDTYSAKPSSSLCSVDTQARSYPQNDTNHQQPSPSPSVRVTGTDEIKEIKDRKPSPVDFSPADITTRPRPRSSKGGVKTSPNTNSSRDHIRNGMASSARLAGSLPVELCSTPSCSSSPCSPENHEISQRIKPNNTSSGRSDLTEQRRHSPNTGINLLANIAVSEGSINDHKSAQSLSDKSSSVCRKAQENSKSAVPEANHTHQKTFPKTTEHFSPSGEQNGSQMEVDRSSTTVSSPSETTAGAEATIDDSTSAKPVSNHVPALADATCKPSTLQGTAKAGTDDGCTNHDALMHPSNQKDESHFLQQTSSVAEVVGDSTGVGVMDKSDLPHSCVLAPKESTSISRSSGDDPLEVARQVAMEVEQEMASCFAELAEREYSDRTPARSGDAMVMSNPASSPQTGKRASPKQSPQVSHASFSAPHEIEQVVCSMDISELSNKPLLSSEVDKPAASQRPVFDLNECLNGEEGNNGTYEINVMPSPSNAFQHVQDQATSSSPVVSKFTSPPAATVTVVAALKGPFVPPVIPARPAGEPRWTGAAATSAFRPARPRVIPEKLNHVSESVRQDKPAEDAECARPMLDFDLNFDLNISVDSAVDMEGESSRHHIDQSLASRTSMVVKETSSSSGMDIPQKAFLPSKRPVLDLNLADDDSDAERGSVAQGRGYRPDFDLNNGIAAQDRNEEVLPGNNRQAEVWNTGNSMPLRSMSSVDGNGIPGFSMSSTLPISSSATPPMSSAASYAFPASAANKAWGNPGFSEGSFPLNVYMQGGPSGFSSSGGTYPFTTPMTVASSSYGGFPFSIGPTSAQDAHQYSNTTTLSSHHSNQMQSQHSNQVQPQHSNQIQSLHQTNQTQSSMRSTQHPMGSSSSMQRSGVGGGRANLDLNAGPEAGEGGCNMMPTTTTTAAMYDQRIVMNKAAASQSHHSFDMATAGMYDQRKAYHQQAPPQPPSQQIKDVSMQYSAMAKDVSAPYSAMAQTYMVTREGGIWGMQGAMLPKQAGGRLI